MSYTEKEHCINGSATGYTDTENLHPHDLVYTSGGWKIKTTTTIWDHFGLSSHSNEIGSSSESFRGIRAREKTRV